MLDNHRNERKRLWEWKEIFFYSFFFSFLSLLILISFFLLFSLKGSFVLKMVLFSSSFILFLVNNKKGNSTCLCEFIQLVYVYEYIYVVMTLDGVKRSSCLWCHLKLRRSSSTVFFFSSTFFFFISVNIIKAVADGNFTHLLFNYEEVMKLRGRNWYLRMIIKWAKKDTRIFL